MRFQLEPPKEDSAIALVFERALRPGRSFLVRFSTAIGLGLAAMFLAWTAAYLFLPEGMLRGKTVAGALSEHTNGLSTFVLALTWNGGVALVVVPRVSVLAVRR